MTSFEGTILAYIVIIILMIIGLTFTQLFSIAQLSTQVNLLEDNIRYNQKDMDERNEYLIEQNRLLSLGISYLYKMGKIDVDIDGRVLDYVMDVGKKQAHLIKQSLEEIEND